MKSEQSGNAAAVSSQRKLRLAYFVSHPIQYQAPLLRRIAQEPDIDLTVFFSSNHSVRGYVDAGFGVKVEWDVPLLDGYNYEFLPLVRKAGQQGLLSSVGNINHGITRKLKDGCFDAVWVHGYQYLTHLQAIRAAHSLKIPVLLRAESTLHDRPRSPAKLAAKRLFFRWLKPRIAAVLPIGIENRDYWTYNLGADTPQFPVHYSVDNGYFQKQCQAAQQTREHFRASLGLEPGRPVILFAAKLTPRKRCPDLLEAYLTLATENVAPMPYLLIVGDGEQRGIIERRMQQAIASSSIQPGDVRLIGFQNQSVLPRFYDLCDVFVLASVDEPWGLAVNEVMNAARPVIVSDQVGCQKNLVRDGVNGCVVRAGDINGLTQSLRRVVGDSELARSMGAESLRIVSTCNFEQNVAGLRQALHAVVAGASIA